MEANEFKKRAKEAVNLMWDSDGPSANSGVVFFISDIQELIEEWESEEHEYSM